jgi:tetratricopeptide (TPR) repeat protein
MRRPVTFRQSCFFGGLILLFASQVLASAQTPATGQQQADELLRAQRWSEAAQAYEAIAKAEPKNAPAWYGLASARYRLEQFAPAAEAFRKNIDLTKNPVAMFNLACVYARMNQKDEALDWLGRALAPENKVRYLLDLNDPGLNALHDDPRYKELWLAADKRKNPCMYRAESRQFDFWIGEWDAFNRQGRKDGTSVIQRIAGGCGILENWTNAFGGGGGKSVNFYDPIAGKWFQYWIGADGNPSRYSGIYKDDAIRYEGEPSTQNGKRVITRMTFFNIDANTVRQLVERSDDEGKTWTISYDYKYVRRGQANGVGSSQ